MFGGNDRERWEYIGGDMAIFREADAQLNNLNKAFPVMSKAWESKLPAINMCAMSVAPRGEDRGKETANRLMQESFIVIQDNQATDVQQQRAFINNLLYSKDDAKKFIDVFDEDFGEEETPAWWRISGKAHVAPKSKAMPRSSAGSEQQGVPPSASSSSGTTGRALWWTSNQPAGKELDDGLVVNQTIQAIFKKISKRGSRPVDHAGKARRKCVIHHHRTTHCFRQPQHRGQLCCARELRSRHARYEVWTRSQSGEESILLGTVFAAFGDNLAHFR